MNKTNEKRQEIKLVGITARTNNQNEMSGENAKIGPCIQHYYQNGLFDQIPNRKSPGITFCCYTDYDSDYKGDYTYFIGEEVSDLEAELPEGLQSIVVEPQSYSKFTTDKGQMPHIVIDAWQQIWSLEEQGSLGGQRTYNTDFELYDARAENPEEAIVDIYIGIHD